MHESEIRLPSRHGATTSPVTFVFLKHEALARGTADRIRAARRTFLFTAPRDSGTHESAPRFTP